MKQGERIKARRITANMTQEEVAKAVGVTKATVQRWESGDIETIKVEKVILLAKKLDTTPEYLLGLEENPNPRSFFTDVRLRAQWEAENPLEPFDPMAFELYRRPIDQQHQKILNLIDEICLAVPTQRQQSTQSTMTSCASLSQDDPDYEKYMSDFADEMLDSLGVINERRLEGLIELLEQMKEIMKLKVKLSDEISPAES